MENDIVEKLEVKDKKEYGLAMKIWRIIYLPLIYLGIQLIVSLIFGFFVRNIFCNNKDTN